MSKKHFIAFAAEIKALRILALEFQAGNLDDQSYAQKLEERACQPD